MNSAKILIVDDELAIRLTLAEMLSNDGYQVTTAENGQAALEIISQDLFDLALIDINLGDMKGTDVLSAMREQSLDTVVIILTAHASLNTAIEALRQGAEDYLFKPCQADELREVIKKGLLKRQLDLRRLNLLQQLEQNLSNTLNDIRATVAGQLNSTPPTMFNSQQVDMADLMSSAGQTENALHKGKFTIDFNRHSIFLNNQALELSPTEFGLLAYLITEAPRSISPQELVSAVQGYETEQLEASDIIRTHIYHIRRKIKQTTGLTNVIRTVRNVGYRLE